MDTGHFRELLSFAVRVAGSVSACALINPSLLMRKEKGLTLEGSVTGVDGVILPAHEVFCRSLELGILTMGGERLGGLIKR